MKLLPLLFGTALSLASASAALAVTTSDRYSSFWVLGDSLSDPGNIFAATDGAIPASPPYFEGRFSNGPIWADYISKDFVDAGKATANFAHGGATAVPDGDLIPDLDAQLGLLSGSASFFGDRPLAALWFGGNDILGADDALAASIAATDAISGSITALIGAGIEDFLIFDLPGLTEDASVFNSVFGAEIASLQASSINIIDIDVTGVINQIALDPTSEITNFTDPCVTTVNSIPVSVCTPEEARQRLRFDEVHPNAEVHARIADQVAVEIAAVPLPPAAVPLLVGLFALGFAGRRRS